MRTKQYTVGEQSRKFLNALDTFAHFENDLMDALQSQYGEEQGEKMYLQHLPQFEDVERTVMEYLRIQFTQGMGGDAATIEI
jgi:hypothetical protein